MPHSEAIAARVREALSHVTRIEEKKMFRGICFMVNGKMCVCVGPANIMCRFDPDLTEEVLDRPGCSPMIRNGKTLKGYAFVDEAAFKSRKDFAYWIDLSLSFNKRAKASKKK